MNRETKDSGIDWIGEIPVDWNIVKIKYLQDITQENSFVDGDWIESPYITNDGIRYLTSGNVGDGIFKRQGDGYISSATFEELNCKYAYPNDLVISRLNAPYGRACILPDDEEKYVLAVDNVILRTKHDIKFLCYVMQCNGYHMSVEEKSAGTAMRRISRTNLGNVKLPIAPLEEQERIVKFLDVKCDAIDQAIQKQKDIVNKLTEYKQATITQMVTRGLECNAEMKNTSISGLAQIPKSWDVIPLKTLFSFSKGLSITKSDLTDEGIKVISYGQIHSKNCDGVHVTDELIRFTADEFKSNNSLAKCGGFIFADTSEDLEGCGNAIYITDEVYGGYHTVVLNPKEVHDYRYLAYLFKTDAWRTELRKQLTEVKVFSITQFALKNMHVILPSYEEMVQIADFLDSKCLKINKSIERSNKIIQKLEEYKKALIYNAVTGKIDCRGEIK